MNLHIAGPGHVPFIPEQYRKPLEGAIGLISRRVAPLCDHQVLPDERRGDRVLEVSDERHLSRKKLLGFTVWESMKATIKRRVLIVLTAPIRGNVYCWLADESFVQPIWDALEFYSDQVEAKDIILHYESCRFIERS